jgi:hypothetical protein
LVGCATVEPVEVTAGASARPPAVAQPVADVSSFQGSITAVDAATGQVTMRVSIVWTPVMKAVSEDRRVTVDRSTRGVPEQSALQVGEALQVKAVPTGDGGWHASEIQLLDLE